MKRVVLPIFPLVLLVAGSLLAQKPEIVTISEIHPGMRGVAYTVFEGVKPEPMEVEVLGLLRNANGPRGDLILVRLHGAKVEYTGVAAGMSGSPVYFDGKLAGALAFRIGEFSKEPIAGVTPIQEMFEIGELDSSRPDASPSFAGRQPKNSPTSGPGLPSLSSGLSAAYVNLLRPIAAPLVFNGFSEDTLRRFAPQFASAGVIPVMGVGSVSGAKQPEPLEPGSSVSAVLVRGDMDISATCTVTYVDAGRLLACGHPILQFGQVRMPMYKAQVLATLPSPSDAFKIINVTESAGAFVQDRHTGILGRFGEEATMIPVTLTIRGAAQPKQFHYEVLNHGKLTPVAMTATVFQALQGMNEYGEDVTYSLRGRINVGGFPAVNLQNMFAPADAGNPIAFTVASAVGERFDRIYENPYARPDIQGVELDFDLVKERRWARLETSRTDVTEVRPGDDIVVEAVLRPYRGERIVRQVSVRIPSSTRQGTLRILVSDGDTLDRMHRVPAVAGPKFDLSSTIALLNKEHTNTRLYVSLLEPNPEALVEDKVMPALPLSIMNVMEGMRRTQDMVVEGESAVNEASTPVDYVVSGAQVITVTVK
jgi:hypothetical protein